MGLAHEFGLQVVCVRNSKDSMADDNRLRSSSAAAGVKHKGGLVVDFMEGFLEWESGHRLGGDDFLDVWN